MEKPGKGQSMDFDQTFLELLLGTFSYFFSSSSRLDRHTRIDAWRYSRERTRS